MFNVFKAQAKKEVITITNPIRDENDKIIGFYSYTKKEG